MKTRKKKLTLNRVYRCDNLNLLKRIPEKSVDLIYLDGPYFTQKDWGDFRDIFKSLDDYREFMRARLELGKKAMKDGASVCLHADYHAVHYLRVDMDNIFGYNNLINELIWDRNNKGGNRSRNRFIRTHETILVYSRGKEYTFNMQYGPLSQKQRARFKHNDNDGNGPYRWQHGPDLINRKDLDVGIKSGKYIWTPKSKCPCYKLYLWDRKGTPPGSVIKGISSCSKSNRHNYATEKPEKLSELLIESFTNPGDTVLDLFCGSGTACVVAKRLGRNYIGCDINPDAIKIAKKRLKKV
jgi:site-specific DNA-methyltransferase (adenine-specific)